MADSSWVIKKKKKKKAALRAIEKGEEQMVSFKLFLGTKSKSAPRSVKSKLFHCLSRDTVGLDQHSNDNPIQGSHDVSLNS